MAKYITLKERLDEAGCTDSTNNTNKRYITLKERLEAIYDEDDSLKTENIINEIRVKPPPSNYQNKVELFLKNINQFNHYKEKINDYLRHIHIDYVTLKQQNPNIIDDDFELLSFYIFAVGKMEENKSTSKIDVSAILIRFADHISNSGARFGDLEKEIVVQWRKLNKGFKISNKLNILPTDINIVNKHTDSLFYDYDVSSITNKSLNVNGLQNRNYDRLDINSEIGFAPNYKLEQKRFNIVKDKLVTFGNSIFETVSEQAEFFICSYMTYD